MKSLFESKYHILEENHWWFKARRDMLIKLIKNSPKKVKILDIGCSGGALIKELTAKGFLNCTGIDASKNAIDLAKKKGVKNCYLMDGENLELEEKFDLIIASDVLEHIKDDKKAIQSWKKYLKKEGRIICFVPAFKFLWSQHDVDNQHYRRYEKKTFRTLFESEQMELERVSFWNFSLFFPVSLTRLIQRFLGKKKSQLNETNALTNSVLYNLLKIENNLLKYLEFPMGVSLFIVAKNK